MFKKSKPKKSSPTKSKLRPPRKKTAEEDDNISAEEINYQRLRDNLRLDHSSTESALIIAGQDDTIAEALLRARFPTVIAKHEALSRLADAGFEDAAACEQCWLDAGRDEAAALGLLSARFPEIKIPHKKKEEESNRRFHLARYGSTAYHDTKQRRHTPSFFGCRS